MKKNTTGSRSRNSSTKFDTLGAAVKLMNAMAIAIDNMIEEVKKPVDQDVNGSARKAELQAVKQTAVDCKELIKERQSLEQMVKRATRKWRSPRRKRLLRRVCREVQQVTTR